MLIIIIIIIIKKKKKKNDKTHSYIHVYIIGMSSKQDHSTVRQDNMVSIDYNTVCKKTFFQIEMLWIEHYSLV